MVEVIWPCGGGRIEESFKKSSMAGRPRKRTRKLCGDRSQRGRWQITSESSGFRNFKKKRYIRVCVSTNTAVAK